MKNRPNTVKALILQIAGACVLPVALGLMLLCNLLDPEVETTIAIILFVFGAILLMTSPALLWAGAIGSAVFAAKGLRAGESKLWNVVLLCTAAALLVGGGLAAYQFWFLAMGV